VGNRIQEAVMNQKKNSIQTSPEWQAAFIDKISELLGDRKWNEIEIDEVETSVKYADGKLGVNTWN